MRKPIYEHSASEIYRAAVTFRTGIAATSVSLDGTNSALSNRDAVKEAITLWNDTLELIAEHNKNIPVKEDKYKNIDGFGTVTSHAKKNE